MSSGFFYLDVFSFVFLILISFIARSFAEPQTHACVVHLNWEFRRIIMLGLEKTEYPYLARSSDPEDDR